MTRLARRLRTVLVVDDDTVLLSALERDLRGRGLTVLPAPTAERARELARTSRPDCAFVDLYIGDDSGIDLLRDLKAELPDLLVVLLTGHGGVQNVVDAFHGGAVDFVEKPVGAQQLMQALEKAVARSRGPSPTLASAEYEHITRVLRECNGNISEAARRLGIHRRSLQRKLQKTRPR
ncbi:MAG TPA: response regulator [Polyangia bacterium]